MNFFIQNCALIGIVLVSAVSSAETLNCSKYITECSMQHTQWVKGKSQAVPAAKFQKAMSPSPQLGCILENGLAVLNSAYALGDVYVAMRSSDQDAVRDGRRLINFGLRVWNRAHNTVLASSSGTSTTWSNFSLYDSENLATIPGGKISGSTITCKVIQVP